MSAYQGAKISFVVDGAVGPNSGLADFVLTPKLREGYGEWRTTLKWAAKKLDLDASVKWGMTTVAASNPTKKSHGLQALLTNDATEGPGTEILYLSSIGDCDAHDETMCDIRYEVSDLKTKSVASSNAEVTLRRGPGDGLAPKDYSFKVADCPKAVSKDGAYWHVATIDGKTNKMKWSCTTGEPAPPAWGTIKPNTTSYNKSEKKTAGSGSKSKGFVNDTGAPPPVTEDLRLMHHESLAK